MLDIVAILFVALFIYIVLPARVMPVVNVVAGLGFALFAIFDIVQFGLTLDVVYLLFTVGNGFITWLFLSDGLNRILDKKRVTRTNEDGTEELISIREMTRHFISHL